MAPAVIHPLGVTLRGPGSLGKTANIKAWRRLGCVKVPQPNRKSGLIASGVELAEVSMLLGHSELRVTMDFYGHLQKQTAAKAARQMDVILG